MDCHELQLRRSCPHRIIYNNYGDLLTFDLVAILLSKVTFVQYLRL